MAYEPYGYPLNPFSYNPMGGNPMSSYQAHLQNMAHQQGAQPPLQSAQQGGYPQPQYQPPVMLKGRTVTGVEEARAAQIDLDGSLHIFPDVANGKIHTKQIGLNGAAVFSSYEYVPPAAPVVTTFDADKIAALEGRITELETMIKTYGGMIENGVQHTANNGTATKQRKSDATAPTVCSK